MEGKVAQLFSKNKTQTFLPPRLPMSLSTMWSSGIHAGWAPAELAPSMFIPRGGEPHTQHHWLDARVPPQPPKVVCLPSADQPLAGWKRFKISPFPRLLQEQLEGFLCWKLCSWKSPSPHVLEYPRWKKEGKQTVYKKSGHLLSFLITVNCRKLNRCHCCSTESRSLQAGLGCSLTVGNCSDHPAQSIPGAATQLLNRSGCADRRRGHPNK